MGLKTKEQQKIDQEKDFENQIINYSNLGITKSKRGRASLAIIVIIVIALLLGVFEVVPIGDALLGSIVYIPLAIFVYRGYRWAMVGTMIMWTIDKGYQLYSLNGEIIWSVVIWWAILVMFLYEALKVESERKRRNVGVNSNTITQETVAVNSYCSKCGKELYVSSNFCKFCGNKLN